MNTLTDRGTWIGIGAQQGVKWSLGLAFAYILWGLFDMLTLSFSMAFTDGIEQLLNGSTPSFQPDLSPETITTILILIPITLIVGGIIGGIPALIIGVVSGMILGGLLSHHTISPSPKTQLIASSVLGIVVALGVNIAALPFFSDEYGRSIQMSYIGLPSVVYIIVCLILSQRIPLLVERAHAKESPVEHPPVLEY